MLQALLLALVKVDEPDSADELELEVDGPVLALL